MAQIPNPNVEDLLPPFLAHIPIAFSSSQPPPSLLVLLAPILRSRVTLLSGPSLPHAGVASNSLPSLADSWLSHLTWSSSGAELCESLSQQDFSPHPSGEFEIGEYEFKGIRRSDEETIKSRVELPERGIEVFFLWVEKSVGSRIMGMQAGEDAVEEEGWKIVDVKLINDKSSGSHQVEEKWYPTVAEAEECYRREKEAQKQHQTVKETQLVTSPPVVNPYLPLPTSSQNQQDNEDEDDSYWDMYDRSPARTPAVQHQTHIQNDDEYFARYNNVEAALDKESTEPEPAAPGRVWYNAPVTYSSHSGVSQNTTLQQPQVSLQALITQTPPAPSTFPPFTVPMSPPISSTSKPTSLASSTPPLQATTEIKAPSPRGSPRAGSPSSVSSLERLAAKQMQAETGVKQHIGTTIKSLFRMARVVGMDREEFDRVVRTELEILGMVEEEESGGSGSW